MLAGQPVPRASEPGHPARCQRGRWVPGRTRRCRRFQTVILMSSWWKHGLKDTGLKMPSPGCRLGSSDLERYGWP